VALPRQPRAGAPDQDEAGFPYLEWTNQLASWDTEELQPLLDDLE
jgi:hypothetical protein